MTVIVTGDNGIRADYTLTVVEKSDVSEIKSKFVFDNEAKFSYDVKLMKGSEDSKK